MNDFIIKYGGRRFLITLGCGCATAVLAWFGKIDGATYAMVELGTVGAYIGGNTYQKIKGANNDGGG